MAEASEDKAAGLYLYVRLGESAACGTPAAYPSHESGCRIRLDLEYADVSADNWRKHGGTA